MTRYLDSDKRAAMRTAQKYLYGANQILDLGSSNKDIDENHRIAHVTLEMVEKARRLLLAVIENDGAVSS